MNYHDSCLHTVMIHALHVKTLLHSIFLANSEFKFNLIILFVTITTIRCMINNNNNRNNDNNNAKYSITLITLLIGDLTFFQSWFFFWFSFFVFFFFFLFLLASSSFFFLCVVQGWYVRESQIYHTLLSDDEKSGDHK